MIDVGEVREEVGELRERIGKWTSEQGQCAEREEYEEAERLQNRIEEAEKKVKRR
jgi:hypothetical protein